MMDFLNSLLACLGTKLSGESNDMVNEKGAGDLDANDKMAEKFLRALATAREPVGEALGRRLKGVIGVESWTEDLAASILARLRDLVAGSASAGPSLLGPALRDSLEKAEEAADGVFAFARDHPEAVAVFCTVLALGVLWAASPWVLGILGFAEEGPVAGKHAPLPT